VDAGDRLMSSLSKRLRRKHLKQGAETPPDDALPDDGMLLLVLTCVDCPKQVAVPMAEVRGRGLTAWLFLHGGWLLSVRGPDRGAPPGKALLVPLCRSCAEKGVDPELLKAADDSLGKKVQS
jgi:hypothetical protein